MSRFALWANPGRFYRLPTPVPAFVTGTEMVTNGDMELDASWSNSGSPASNVQSNEQAHAGTYSRKLVTDASAEGCTQSVTGHGNNKWYQAQAYLYGTDTAGLQVILGSLLTSSVYVASNGAWMLSVICGKSVTAGGSVTCRANAAGGTTFYADDVSVRELSLASLLSTMDLPGQADCRLRTRVTLSQNTTAGLIARLDSASSPANGLLLWRDRTRIHLETLIAGAWAEKINTTNTYVPGQVLEMRMLGDQVSVWYSGSQVGTTQTIADGATNTRHGTFSCFADNALGGLWVGRP